MTKLIFSPPVIAHRGASGYAPENTLPAFTKAVQLGIKWVEFDVMVDRDYLPIIFHDETLDRITNGTGEVYWYPYIYLKTLDAGKWFHPNFASECILTLASGVKFLNEMQMYMNIELKPIAGEEEIFIKHVLELLDPYLIAHNNRILFSSFSIEMLYLLRKHRPYCQIGLLLHEWVDNWQQIAKDLGCLSIHLFDEIISKEVVKEINTMNKAVLCYTVNDPERARELLSWGVAAVFSDFPDKIIAALDIPITL